MDDSGSGTVVHSHAPWGSRLLGSAEENSGVRRIRIQILLTAAVVMSNLFGIALVVALVGFVLPGPSLFTRELRYVNTVALPLYAAVALVVGVLWGTRWALSTLSWTSDPDRIPTEDEQASAVRVPRHLVIVQGVLWLGAIAVLTPLYGRADPALIPKVVLGIGATGIGVCANSYLASQFALRAVTARVLDAGHMRRRRGMGVFGRSVLVWLLGTGVPVALSMIVAVQALLLPEVSKARLAVCVLTLGGVTLVYGLLMMMQTLAATVAPIRGVRRALRQVENGDLGVVVTVYDGTELGELQTGFNHMVQGLREREQIRELFGKHVGHEVAVAAIASESALGGTECEAAALFIDIIGSTTMAATLPANDLVQILNRFFGIVVDEVERHGGLLNKFEGDAALAVFGTPAELDSAAGAALACARAIQDQLICQSSDFTASIGVAAGRVVAGNVGSDQRYEFTVIGDAVNEAARLCELAKQEVSLILTSGNTVAAADSAEAANWSVGESVILRGRLTPTALARPYEVARVFAGESEPGRATG
ncbi:adenylate/guanylate cyclase domain-containing protein [Nocardia sp. NPDC003693]